MEKQYLEWAELVLYNTLLNSKIETQINASKYDDTDVKQRIASAESTLTALNGTGNGSIKKLMDDAFNEFATKISDDNVVNTYKELIDYCASHSAEAAEMAGNIEDNERAVSTLETYIGKLPEGTEASTMIEYINEKTGAEILKIQSELNAYKDSNNSIMEKISSAITSLQEQLSELENIEFVPITAEQINSLFEPTNSKIH